MNMNKVAILGFILFFVLMYCLYLLIKVPEPTQQIIDNYINNSVEIKLEGIRIINSENRLSYARLENFFKKRAERKEKNVALLKTDNDDKYFKLEIYEPRIFINIDFFSKHSFYAVVNKDELNDPQHGTFENPVIILLYYENANDRFSFIDEKYYKHGVKEYIKYFKK